MNANRTLVAGIFCAVLAGAGLVGPLASTARADDNRSLEQRRAEALFNQAGNQDLRRRAYGRDFDAAWAAMQELREQGEAGRMLLHGAVRTWLNRDRQEIRTRLSQLGNPERIRQFELEFVELQQRALANIKDLTTGEPVALAHEYYRELQERYRPLSASYEVRYALITTLSRRRSLLDLWKEIAPDDERTFSAEAEEALHKSVEDALGTTLQQAAAQLDPNDRLRHSTEVEPSEYLLARYAYCRQVQAYNESVESMFNRDELANARLVNEYREWLGLDPLEYDARLTEAARGHSREMHELDYFSHTSPVAENETPSKRARKAGYPGGAGENIYGGSGGVRGFWAWFDSPGHHRNMTGAGYRAIGVGQAPRRLTQKFGSAERMMNQVAQQD